MRSVMLIAIALLLAGLAGIGLRVTGWTRPAANAAGTGARVPDMGFVDLDGRAGRFAEYRGRPLAVVVRDADCPVSRRYGPETARLEREYAGRGVAFLYVNVNSADDGTAARGDADRFGLRERYVHDRGQRLGRALRLRTSAEVLLLDGEGVVRYRGAIDDQYGIRHSRAEPTTRPFRDALDAVLAGRAVRVTDTTPEGCLLGLDEPS